MAVTLSVQVKNATLKRQGLEHLRQEIPNIGAQRIYETLKRAQDQLKKPGRKPTYPIQWDSERQRRASFATDGFGRGIPTKRSNAYIKAWKIRRNPSSQKVQAGYSLINDSLYARYVGGSAYGDGQSRIHQGRWPLVRDVMERQVAKLPKSIEDNIGMVARREKLK